MHAVVFPLGVRLSTWLVLAAFLVLGLRDRRAWLAAAAWLAGFEVAWQATGTIRRALEQGLHPQTWWAPVVVFGTYACGIVFVIIAARFGARPSLWLLAVVAGIWAVWVATGFYSNNHAMLHFDAGAEAMNEAAKTLWAVAYLVPLWALSRRPTRTAAARRSAARARRAATRRRRRPEARPRTAA